MASKNKPLPNHMKVAFCKILDQAGAYSVVLRRLFPPEKNKKIHKLVFKYETKKCQLTIKEWQDLFKECHIMQDFYAVVKKYTGEDNLILVEERDEDDAALTEFNRMHIVENPIGNHTDPNKASEDSRFQKLSPASKSEYYALTPKGKRTFLKGVEAGRRMENREVKETGENTINPEPFKAAFEGTPSTNRGEPVPVTGRRRLFDGIEAPTRVTRASKKRPLPGNEPSKARRIDKKQ